MINHSTKLLYWSVWPRPLWCWLPEAWPTCDTQWCEPDPRARLGELSESLEPPTCLWNCHFFFFTQWMSPHKVEGKSDLPGKENNPTFSPTHILVPGVIYSHFWTSPFDFDTQWFVGSILQTFPRYSPRFLYGLKVLNWEFLRLRHLLLPKSLAFHFHLFYTFGDSLSPFPSGVFTLPSNMPRLHFWLCVVRNHLLRYPEPWVSLTVRLRTARHFASNTSHLPAQHAILGQKSV